MAVETIEIASGKISGIPCGDPAFTVFKGIPYAAPPVGDLRWSAPQPPKPWEGVRACNVFPPAAVQNDEMNPTAFYQKEFHLMPVPMDEDCLYLNVWTPADTGKEKLPVMVWIHGGAYMQGYSYEMEFDGEAFCKRDVILVTVAYRLGALGFFAHPELSKKSKNGVSGNYGILDIVEALKWIQKNIGAFGGDAENVTIFGQSAGGGAVQCLITSELSKGLFHKAIVQSAGGIETLGGRYTLKQAEAVGAQLCEMYQKDMDELMRMPAMDLTKRVLQAYGKIKGAPGLIMAPNVDGYVLMDTPGDAIAKGKHHDVPYLTGSVSGDGALFGGPSTKTKEEFEGLLKFLYGDQYDQYHKLFDVKSNDDVEKANRERTRAVSMLAPRSWAEAHLKIERPPVYLYYFDREIPGEDKPGAFHSSELWYIFGTIHRCWRPMTGVDFDISNRMTTYWTNFAKKGDPNGEGVPDWPAFTSSQPVTMRIHDRNIGIENMGKDPIVNGMVKLLIEKVYKDQKEV